MAAHRYWRLRNLATSYFTCTELQMREVAGGPNVVGGGTPIASSVYQGTYLTARAFDGNTGMPEWHSDGAGAGNNWLGYDFGAGNAKDIVQIVYSQRSEASWSPNSWAFEYSDDGSDWTTARVGSGSFPADSTTVLDVFQLDPSQVKNRLFPPAFLAYTRPSPGTPAQPVFNPDSQYRERPGLQFVGMMGLNPVYKLAGSTTSLGDPVPRRVRLYNQRDGRLAREQITAEDGAFEFTHIEQGPWQVVGVDDTGAQNGVIYTHVLAVPM